MARDVLDNATWRRSTRSLNGNAECVEVAMTPHAVGVRDSKDRRGPRLVVTTRGWAAFVDAVKRRTLH
ncbi:DUF397 domain-containing protein [Micromonospora endophytica]|uniref:DUF397 domain-containing protein n=1 Tax=Micromonospora endophytica TaxID=515350 RepID=A0A2W2D1Z2_9ACTN|nr:DUF397 domain-containing protein [Micromonospora endophytica]PZF86543.1 DUF397 domain-containing protein [Micromonospora endophytica]RIW49560.1 DUF397 domain-containing protein [Micromonospora endophytica]BCJ62628.1 hypothetical protein Jiend_60500 [Micromonospora endophytica]